MRSRLSVIGCRLSVFLLIAYSLQVTAYSQDSGDYVKKAWALRGAKNYTEAYTVIDECVEKFSSSADKLAKSLNDFPAPGNEIAFKIMNDVTECHFIKAEALREQGRIDEAKLAFQAIVDKYPFAKAFDPRGWYWSLGETAKKALAQIAGKHYDEPHKIEEQTAVKLYDSGYEFPVDYEKYGKFEGRGSKNYKYIVEDPIGLAKAVGEGIHPNTSSIKFDPEYVRIKKSLGAINHWKVFNSRDLNTAFHKWNFAPESAAVRQFSIADILERSGLIESAIKAYYAVLVHFPNGYGWTYWHTPWYVGKVALYRIKYLLKNNPEIGLKLEGAGIEVVNGYDNSVRNDFFLVNPGRLVKMSFWEKTLAKFSNQFLKKKGGFRDRKPKKVVQSQGKRVRLVKYDTGDWQMFVEGKPFMVKAVTYGPTKVGESPDEGTHKNWSTQDLNENSLIDSPFEAWVDKNGNNTQDKGEKTKGDFQLMKEMGLNSIRVYHQPFELNKKIFRQMYEKYGIYILLGDFLGKYTLGSGAEWEKGTDYDNPQHRQNMLESIEKMVREFKDEPYVVMWLIGNENVYGLGCNADKKPESFFKFANKAAKLIKSLDPQKRPVAIVSGDILFLDIFAKNCPDIDIFGTNAYRGAYGFLDIWDEVKRATGKPAMITEYGTSSYAQGYSDLESQEYQANYHRACWLNTMDNSVGRGAGCALGGIAFEWLDEWWKAYEPAYHDRKGLFSGPFLDGYMHEEWLGICGQGDGSKSPYLRELKKAYYAYQELWN
jgi:beta-glucuronidase